MHAPLAGSPSDKRTGLVLLLGRISLLLLPVTLLLICSVRGTSQSPHLLWLGTLFQLLAFGLSLFGRQGWREPTGAAVIMLYVIALNWMLLGTIGTDDWVLHLAKAVLLVVPLVYFAVQCLMESGAPALRRAHHLAARLAGRLDWPRHLHDCRLLPEVKALREALHVDASPALGIAQVVQRRLGVDLGLPRDQPLPSLHSRQAAEVARRVLVWATHQDATPEPVLQGEDDGWHELREIEESP
jgi:hypothetical protein